MDGGVPAVRLSFGTFVVPASLSNWGVEPDWQACFGPGFALAHHVFGSAAGGVTAVGFVLLLLT